jgi:hypothetical protein
MKACITAACCLLLYFFSPAQDKVPVKFGKVEPADFEIKQAYDTGAAAVVIADVGESYFEPNQRSGIDLIHKRKFRAKILSTKGFDIAEVEIPLYISGLSEEKISALKASTYNLENGKVVEIELDKASIFKEKLDDNNVIRKFTFPGIKEGSIIEYSYQLASPYFRSLRSWTFQDKYPVLWSEYNVSIPDFFSFVQIAQGYHPFHIKKTQDRFQEFRFNIATDGGSGRTEHFSKSVTVSDSRWVAKDVPALVAEKFTSSINNHITRIAFQLSFTKDPFERRSHMGDWYSLSEELLKAEYFGAQLSKNNNWLDDDMKRICGDAKSQIDKAKRIFEYVRDNFTCTDYTALYLQKENNLKRVLDSRSGNVAEINLLLAVMLRHEGINADPIILSRRPYGFTNEIYPLISKFNYVVIVSTIDNSDYVMDASRPYLGFNRLSADCYNGHARIVAKEPSPVYFLADSLKESNMISVIIIPDEKTTTKFLGGVTQNMGYYTSLSARDEIRREGKDAFFKKIKSEFPLDVIISNPSIDSMRKKEEPIQVGYDFDFELPDDDVVYFNPMMNAAIKENYFKSAERHYPVEMPFAMNETYIFDMEVPKGYIIDEIPKSAKVAYNDGEGIFEYMTSKDEGHVRLRMRLQLNKATFAAEEYESLREFFGYIVKKHAEMVVLKKAK